MNTKHILCIAALLLLVIGGRVAAHAQTADNREEILRAMRDELKRSMEQLRLDDLQKPYYIEYRLVSGDSWQAGGTFGSLVESTKNEHKRLTVGVRVGSPDFDNTNFFDVSLNFFGTTDDEETYRNRAIAAEQNYPSLRRELWLATDAAYKQAAEIYSKKEAAIKNRVRLDTTPDFTTLSKAVLEDIEKIPPFNRVYFEDLCRSVSGVFREYPKISLSRINIEYIPETVYYVNSEGREMVKTELFSGLEITAATQAADGMPIAQTYTAYAFNPANLPAKDSLLRITHTIARTLSEQVDSELIAPYSGPVVFEGQAAAEVFGQIFLPNLVTVRAPLQDGGFQEKPRHSAFQNKVGGRVLPEFISVDVKPDKDRFGTMPLVGSYILDDEAVKPESFRIVDGGYLQTLMSSRVPTRRIKQSNGHQRGGAAMLSVLEVQAEEEKTWQNAKLYERMMELCKARELEYGIVVRKALNINLLITSLYPITNGEYPFTRGEGIVPLLEAYKVYPDGRRELIRGVEVSGISHQSFKDILALGSEQHAYNYLAPAVTSPFYTGGRSYLPVSIITGNVLFEDLEITPLEEDFAKPPILGHPYFSEKK